MKVWEKCNELKGATATREQIADWAYMNRVCPVDFDIGLELDEGQFPAAITEMAHAVCTENSCGMDCLYQFLDMEAG